YLSEFGLSVRTQILITEALNDLEITVKSRNHQQLLKRLRRLRERIKLSGIHTARHYEITCPFGGGFDEYRRFYFQKIPSVEILTGFLGKSMAQYQIVAYRIATKVQIAILHS